MNISSIVFEDERGVAHEITERNQRVYFGRAGICNSCSKQVIFRELPWSCELCGSTEPATLQNRPADWWNQPMLETSSVLVIGCGAVGNETVKNLALLGIKTFTLVDFDIIEIHNLNRSILFHEGARNATESLYKVDVMAEALNMIDPSILVKPLKTGVLDARSKEKLRRGELDWPEPPLDAERLKLLALEHDICIIATDGLSPKVFASRHLYHTLPIVQGAMNSRGTAASARSSLPLTNACIICPTVAEPQQRYEDGAKEGKTDWRPFEDEVGENPCRFAAAATGALSFAHTTAMLGAAMASQAIIILHGWPDFALSEFKIWPRAIPLPLWNEVALMSPFEPGGDNGPTSSRYLPINLQTDLRGNAECYNCREGAIGTVGVLGFRGLYLAELASNFGKEVPIHLDKGRTPPRAENNEGLEKPDRTIQF